MHDPNEISEGEWLDDSLTDIMMVEDDINHRHKLKYKKRKTKRPASIGIEPQTTKFKEIEKQLSSGELDLNELEALVNKHKKSKKPRGKMVEITCACPSCNNKKMVRVADRKRGWGKYCSKSCKAIHQTKKHGYYKDLPKYKKAVKKANIARNRRQVKRVKIDSFTAMLEEKRGQFDSDGNAQF